MKFKRATFRNFRLLRDLSLEFSTDDQRPLTVIRAENESGKTTTLVALQWALFGEDALPAGGTNYRLHPIDWDLSESTRVPVEVSIDFDHTYEKRIGHDQWVTHTDSYRLERRVVESIAEGDQWSRERPTLTLFRMTEEGAKLVERPELELADMLPKDLREVFFTDGDKALSFIEAEFQLRTKRLRVEAAIKALLGLGVLEEAQGHVKQAASEMNKKAKNIQGAADVAAVSSKLMDTQSELADYEARLKDVTGQLTNIESHLLEAERAIEATLKKGDQEQLSRELAQNRENLKTLDEERTQLARRHSELFKSVNLPLAFVDVHIAKASAGLDALKDRGSIPSNAIPVLQERLEMQECICGTPLGEGTQERERVLSIVEEQLQADELSDRLTELYYKAKSYREARETGNTSWVADYREIAARRETLEQQAQNLRSRQKEIDMVMQDMGDSDISALRKNRADLRDQRDRLQREQATVELTINRLKREEQDLTREQEKLLKTQTRFESLLSELEAAADIDAVLRGTHSTILTQELEDVSNAMNEFFMRMIGADPEQGAVIHRAEVTPEFDIVVFGPQQKRLDPDKDLNGASRRALTLAFILALTKVSQVLAPNVVDTPLGMTSGMVKRSVLQTCIDESSQLILFLTPAEISDCEEIIDARAGRILTLTNTAHYPTMLLNEPETEGRAVLRCECTHRQRCKICERVDDVSSGVYERRSA